MHLPYLSIRRIEIQYVVEIWRVQWKIVKSVFAKIPINESGALVWYLSIRWYVEHSFEGLEQIRWEV